MAIIFTGAYIGEGFQWCYQKGIKMEDRPNMVITDEDVNLMIDKYKMSYDPDKHYMTKEEWDRFGDEYGRGLIYLMVMYYNG
jgi:hypothetical protein